jgi:hypothetical protein
VSEYAYLFMRDEETSVAWRVWPNPEPVASGAVHEVGSYLFELTGSIDAATGDLLIDDVRLEALRGAKFGAMAVVAGVSCRTRRSGAPAARPRAEALRDHD